MEANINLDGNYYEFICMNEFVDGTLIKSTEFKNEREADSLERVVRYKRYFCTSVF